MTTECNDAIGVLYKQQFRKIRLKLASQMGISFLFQGKLLFYIKSKTTINSNYPYDRNNQDGNKWRKTDGLGSNFYFKCRILLLDLMSITAANTTYYNGLCLLLVNTSNMREKLFKCAMFEVSNICLYVYQTKSKKTDKLCLLRIIYIPCSRFCLFLFSYIELETSVNSLCL